MPVNKPVYVSVGHRVSLDTAAAVVRALCVFRVPEPVRHADLHSRAFLRGEPVSINAMDEVSTSRPHESFALISPLVH